MRSEEWKQFIEIKKKFQNLVNKIKKEVSDIQVVYNNALDELTKESEIKLILVGDNPGKKEAETGRYLVGPSGKLADKFFRENPELGIDFYKNVIILNKTPIHTHRTIQLKELIGQIDPALSPAYLNLFEKSQIQMAHILLEFQELFNIPIFIIGYSEMKMKGIFETYTKELKQLYLNKQKLFEKIYLFRHFSMNQFTIDLKKQSLPKENIKDSLNRIGSAYRQRIFNMI